MLLLLIALQTSLLARPLYLDAAPPELRSARNLLIVHAGAKGAPAGTQRTREQALELAGELQHRAQAGEDFVSLAREHSEADNRSTGAVLGTFAPGMLEPKLDEFLFSAALGAISEPIATPIGVLLLQRVESEAAVLQIQIDVADQAAESEARARCAQVLAKLSQGADFAALAKEFSDDPLSKKRGGQFAIYERGTHDQLLKEQAFSLGMGSVSEPVRSAVAYHILKRVAVSDVDPALRENHWVRLRAILVQFDLAQGADMLKAPDQAKAREIVDALRKRIQNGEDMAKVATEFNDDHGGKERAGDLGWIHRGAPNLSPMLAQNALLKVGELSEALVTNYGYLLVRRER